MDLQPERASTSISLSSYLRLVRYNRNFRRLWLAQIVSEIGDWSYTLAIYSLLLQLTGRASSVALALVLQVLPQTFIGPAAGVINDRISRKRVMIAADLARMVIVFAMLLVRSRSTVWLVYPLLLLETLMAAFFEPARTSVIPNVAAREDVDLALGVYGDSGGLAKMQVIGQFEEIRIGIELDFRHGLLRETCSGQQANQGKCGFFHQANCSAI